MGRKTPLFILVMGVGGLIVLGVLAQIAFEESPVLQAATSFRSEACERYPVRDVSVRVSEKYLDLTLTIDPERIAVPVKGRLKAWPSQLEGIQKRFRETYPVRLDGCWLRVKLQTPADSAFGWGESRLLWEQMSPTPEEVSQAEAACAKVLGGSCKISVAGAAVIRLESPQRRKARDAREVVPLLSQIGGGGWQRIELAMGGLRFRFNAEGERIH